MSEFRQDLVSGDWVIIAPGRDARPKMLDTKKAERVPAPLAGCPFENPMQANNEKAFLTYPNEAAWEIVALQNKYPALQLSADGVCAVLKHDGIYAAKSGVGRHDLIITRDHYKHFGELDPLLAENVFLMFQTLCRDAAKDPCIGYAVPFANWGQLAGASIWHPHYQFISLPIVPPHSAHSNEGARRYFRKKHRCVRCDILKFEQKECCRIVAENKHAIAIAPYASKYPFEIRIMPKAHASYFYKTSHAVVRDVALLVQSVLRDMKKAMHDPDYNLFIHEAPFKGKWHLCHHWHVEIIPRVSTPAGFEFSTGVFINSVEPERVAELLHS